MNGAQRQPLPGGRWWFEHGPIRCVVGADGDAGVVAPAVDAAWGRFQTVLAELVAELPLLRADLSVPGAFDALPRAPIARRMVDACRPHAVQGRFITAMAAVAGSVAQELIACFERPGIRRAYVNNGGDIALHLADGEHFDVGLVVDPARGYEPGRGQMDGNGPGLERAQAHDLDGRFRIHAHSGVRGVATSGWRGRSFSFGIADSVTVLATGAAQADAAATLIANAVSLDDPRIRRAPANQLRDDTDLGARLVTVGVPELEPHRAALALAGGATFARALLVAGRIHAAALCLQGQLRRIGDPARAGPILRPARPVPNQPPAWASAARPSGAARTGRTAFTGA
jgi:uncharacterized protein